MAATHAREDGDQLSGWEVPTSPLHENLAEIAREIAWEALSSDQRAVELDAKTAFRSIEDPNTT